MGSFQSNWARRRAELLWRQLTKTAAESASTSGQSAVDLKTARLRTLRLSKEATGDSRHVHQPSPRRDQWLEHYGQHLGRLLEPTETLPFDLDQLARALAAKLARANT